VIRNRGRAALQRRVMINEKGKGTTSVVPPSRNNASRLQPLRGMWSGHSCPLLLLFVSFFASPRFQDQICHSETK
jgi:hypothetical protein